MFKWFKEKVLGIKPIFKIELEKAHSDGLWYYIKFSNNNGWTWQYILDETWVPFSYCDEKETEHKWFSVKNLKYAVEEFKTYDDCVKYNNRVIKKIEQYNEFQRKQYDERIREAEKLIEKINLEK